MTLIAQAHPRDETVDDAIEHFGEKGRTQLLSTITGINPWNRFAFTARSVFGTYPSRYARRD